MTARKRKPAAERTGWFLYMLRCRDNTLYTGITTDLSRRLNEHNQGTASRYTRSRRPVAITYHEECPDRAAALKREHAVKKLSRREKEMMLNEVQPIR